MSDLHLPENMPQVGNKRIAVRVTPSAEKHLKRGHPWLFDGSIESISHNGATGDLAVIFDQHRRFAAIGLYDPDSPIRVKVLHAGSPAQIDAKWFAEKIGASISKRGGIVAEGTNGYRLINGENDSLPGLIVDRYADTLVVKLYTNAWIPHFETVLRVLIGRMQPEAIVLRLSRRMQDTLAVDLHDGQVVFGKLKSDIVLFQENGLTFEANVIDGQKTGFFLDQRRNRALLAKHTAGKTVLDLFSSTGGFSVYAAMGGATVVTSVDISEPTLEAAERNMFHNMHIAEVEACEHRLIQDDAFQVMEMLWRRNQTFDVVVIDPPSFAQKQEDIDRAIASYGRLTEMGLGLLRSGGLLVQASCSSRVTADTFFTAIEYGRKRSGKMINEIVRTAHAPDHPVTFSEGAYLKCLFATVE